MLPESAQSRRATPSAPARTSMNGLLPSPVVCPDDPGLHSMFQNGRVKRMVTSFSSVDLKCNGSSNLERSSDSEDSRSGSGATSGKEASPGYAESSGSEQSSGAPLSDEAHLDDNDLPTSSMPRSKTTPLLNGEWGLDDALKSLTQISTDINVSSVNPDVRHNNSLNRIRAAHEINVSKLAYLEALFQRTKLEESHITTSSSITTSTISKRTAPDGRLADKRITDETPVSSYSPDSGYKSSPTAKERKMKTSSSGPCLSSITKADDQSMIDGQTLLRTIESRLQRSQEANTGQRQLYKTGGSASAGSLSRLSLSTAGGITPASTPGSRYTSPSRPPTLASTNMAPVTKRPDGLGGRLPPSYHGGEHSLPHHYRSRSAYSSPAVSPQRGPDPFLLTSPADVSVTRRFSSLDTRGRGEQRGSSRHLPIRHTAHGFPSTLPLSPPSAAQGACALQRKMNLFLEIMDTQWKFSKDLQSEIESHKDVVASLNATGQKLLGTLENQDEAMMLHRRLEEMNTRWNTLKHRSIAIRSRLEGNTESWNSLLLSLRELIEWVIRKDTELTAMGPPAGDMMTLAKLENDLLSFRRVLDEKQPVVESNLKSGRQLVASEPPLSDTSDSEAGRDMEGDARRHGEESARELTRAVRREVTKLSEKWATLRERAGAMATNVTLAHKKLGVLQKTLEEVDIRLEAAEGTVSSWGPVPQDPNLADQHVHNVTKFREGLSELQRGVDDVNDQAARFSAHSVPLAADTSTRLHRLNARWKSLEGAVSDRWRHVAGRSREVTPLTAAQLASSLPQPWERAVANNKVPYYINHAQETTYWDHPEMMALLDSLADLNHIKFSAYRTASKLRALQKKLALDQTNLQMVTDVFDEHGLRGQNDRLIDVADMVVVLSTLYSRISSERPETNTSLTTDLCLNWLLNVYDSQRTGQMRVLSFRVGLVCLCKGHLEEKYRYMFRLIADPNRLVDQRKLGLLLHDCVQVPRQLGEVAAFGGSNIEPSVRSCFTKAGKDREAIEAVHFLSWVQQEPQSLVWLAVLHRVAASEHIQHQVKCNICKTCPIVGLRYRCLKCIGFDMCQQCFFDGRSSKNHKVTHPMHEYCTATTAGDEMKDFTKALKNKFKSKRSLQKHAKKGYLPVQTVLEGDPLESPSPSPQHGVGSQDMHNRLELYASRLAEVELRTNSNSTPDSEDEHGLIAQYCQSLSSGDGAPLPVPRSPLQVMAAVDADQKDELEQMIRELEEENQALQAEYEQLKLQQDPSDSPSQSSGGSPLRSETEMLAEARLLRQHKGRLEARMTILEQHNQQLEAQLHRLRQLLQQQNGGSSPNKSGTLQTKSVTASQLATDSPAKVNGHSSQGDLERAVGNLVATVTHDQANGSPNAAEGEASYRHHTSLAPEYDRNQRRDDNDDEEEEEIEQYDNNPMPAEKDR